MIEVITATSRWALEPTIFPDGTSQVWKLPEDVLRCSSVDVDWRFESEREILDILSLNKLLKNQLGTLHVPYLPYARQDKEVSNTSTFNLEVLADLINSTGFTRVTSVDVHNSHKTEDLINNFSNIYPEDFHNEVIRVSEPTHLVYPDAGAADRYHSSATAHIPKIVCDKKRDQLTGAITGHKIIKGGSISTLGEMLKFLIIDDLCDGGATFVSVARVIRSNYGPSVFGVDLCVTHGLFSKGREHLLANGIDKLYTTNSLTKNGDGYDV